MFGRKKEERPAIIDEYDRKWWSLNDSADKVKKWAQAVKWYGLPLKVFIEDTPEWKAAAADVKGAQLSLRNAMGIYDAYRHEFMEWVKRHFDELPENYQQYGDPDTSINIVRYALSDINKNDYFYFKYAKN